MLRLSMIAAVVCTPLVLGGCAIGVAAGVGVGAAKVVKTTAKAGRGAVRATRKAGQRVVGRVSGDDTPSEE